MFWNSTLKWICGKIGQIYFQATDLFTLRSCIVAVTCGRPVTIPMNSHQFAPWWDGCRFTRIGTTQIWAASLQITEDFPFQDVMISGHRQPYYSFQATWVGCLFLSNRVKYSPLQKEFLFVTKLDKQSHQYTETLFCLLLLNFVDTVEISCGCCLLFPIAHISYYHSFMKYIYMLQTITW